MRATDNATRRRRRANLKRLGLHEAPWYADAAGGGERSAWPKRRYLLVKQSYYDDQPDEADVVGCDTLADCEREITGHLSQRAGPDYSFDVDVYDLDRGLEVGYDVVRAVHWHGTVQP
jgi:hypothetical protein